MKPRLGMKPLVRLPRLALCVALLGAMAQSLSALQLGETKEALVARHGAPGVEDHARNLAMYFWDGWSAQLEFQGNNVRKIAYRRNWYLQDEEIASLLEANGGAGRWVEISAAKDKTRIWARDDGAAAACPRYRPLSIVFETDSTGSPSGANAAAPAGQSPATNQPAAGAPATGSGQNAPPSAPVAPPAQAEAIEAPADPTPAVKAASAPPLHAAHETAAQPGASEKTGEGRPVFMAARGLAYLFGALAVLALAGSGVYVFKRRVRPIGALPEVARRS